MLLDLKRRGLTVDPRLAIGDGARGFWKALRSTDGKFHRSHILYQTMGLHAHPSILGPGFREPSPRTWFRPSRASIPFEGMGLRFDRPEFEAPREYMPCR